MSATAGGGQVPDSAIASAPPDAVTGSKPAPRKPASSDQRTRGSSSTMRMRARNSARQVGTNPRRGKRLIMNRSRKVMMPGATARRRPRLGRRRRRKGQTGDGPAAVPPQEGDGSVLQGDKTSHDRETEAGAALLGRMKGFEQALGVGV